MLDYQTAKYHVGLNAALLSASNKGTYRQAGIHSYIDGVLSKLHDKDSRFDYSVFVNLRENDSIYNLDAIRVPKSIDANPISRIIWEQSLLALSSIKHSFDLLHGMAFVTPLFGLIPSIVTVYDLSFLKYPEYIQSGNRAYLSLFTKLSCIKARRIIAISNNTKNDLVDLFGINKDKIDVIYPGINANMKRADSKQISHFRKKKGLPDKFILYLGTIEPRKNLSVLIQAYNKVKHHGVKLVCVGGKGWLYEDVFRIVDDLQLGRDVIFPGFIPKEELALWYSACSLFVYPSVYEGFGMPVLEALACGAIVVTSNSSSLPEVVGDAAFLVTPNNVDQLASTMDDILCGKHNCSELSLSAVEQSCKFNWNTSSKLTVDTYARALGLIRNNYENN